MKILAFDTSTETLSLALTDGARQWQHEAPGGAQASATLIPALLGLLAQAGLRLADLDLLVFGRGPGSFTGLRTACSVAQGLAFGVEATRAPLPVLPLDTLLALAEDARRQSGATRVTAVLDARMGEVYAASYRFEPAAGGAAFWRPDGDGPQLLRPADLTPPPGFALAGNAFAAHAACWPDTPMKTPALPRADAMLRLAPALFARGLALRADDALPLYVRDKVAQTSAERMAAPA